MSRSQQTQTFNTATGQNAGYNANAQTSYNNAQTNEGNYEDQLSQYAAANPYTQGGQFQTAENQQLSNTADAGAQSAGNAIQSAAVRTGQNPAGAIAATEAIADQNDRNLAGQEGAATQQRIGNEAGYNANVLNASQQPANFEAQLAGQQGQLAQGTLGTAEQAANTPSFTDELGNGLIQGVIGAGTAAAGAAAKGCWIAATLYGGWDDPRTHAVREWIFGPFAERWYGFLLAGLYLRLGEQIARRIPEHPWLRRALLGIFNAALRASQREEGK